MCPGQIPCLSVVGNGSRIVFSSEGNIAKPPLSSVDTPVQGLASQLDPALPIGGSAFPPIADYGFLSDCETVALVAPNGGVE